MVAAVSGGVNTQNGHTADHAQCLAVADRAGVGAPVRDGELVGAPEPWRSRLGELVDSLFRADTDSEEAVATQRPPRAVEPARRDVRSGTRRRPDQSPSPAASRRRSPRRRRARRRPAGVAHRRSRDHDQPDRQRSARPSPPPGQLALAVAGEAGAWVDVVEPLRSPLIGRSAHPCQQGGRWTNWWWRWRFATSVYWGHFWFRAAFRTGAGHVQLPRETAETTRRQRRTTPGGTRANPPRPRRRP